MHHNDNAKFPVELNPPVTASTRKNGLKERNNAQGRDHAPLASLPNDIKNLVCTRYLNDIDAFHFFRAAPRSLQAIYPDVAKRKDNPLRKLLSHAALGELEQAEKICRAYPDLLIQRGTVYHPNYIYDAEGDAQVSIPFFINPGRYAYKNRTFYQILLMNAEFEEAREWGRWIGLKEQQKQFNEIFPDGEIKKYHFDLEEAKKLLQAVFDAIAEDPSLQFNVGSDSPRILIMGQSTRKALYELYRYAKPNSAQGIGLVFDPRFYHAALQLLIDNYKQLPNKLDYFNFWAICVEEWLAGCLGTAFLRRHAQGLIYSHSNGDKTKLTRLGCILQDKSSIFAFRRPANSIPGAHFFVGYFSNIKTFYWDSLPAHEARCKTFKSFLIQQEWAGYHLRNDLQIDRSALHRPASP